MRLDNPGYHLTGLACRQYRSQHEPSVLGQHTSVIKLQYSVIGLDAYHAFGSIGRNQYGVTGLKRQGIDKLVCATVIVCTESLELTGFLIIGNCLCLTYRIARKSVGTAVHKIGLAPVL